MNTVNKREKTIKRKQQTENRNNTYTWNAGEGWNVSIFSNRTVWYDTKS